MRIEHKNKAANSFQDLPTIQKIGLVVAVLVAFADVFGWFIKIIFF
jgi:hypothetical protein